MKIENGLKATLETTSTNILKCLLWNWILPIELGFPRFSFPTRNCIRSENVFTSKYFSEILFKVVCLFLSVNQTNHVDYAKNSFKARAEKGKMGKHNFAQWIGFNSENAIKISLSLSWNDGNVIGWVCCWVMWVEVIWGPLSFLQENHWSLCRNGFV